MNFLLVQAKIHPSAKSFKIILKGEVLHIYLTEPARENRANKQLLKELNRRFGSCRIVRGAKSSKKTLDLPVKSLKGLKVL